MLGLDKRNPKKTRGVSASREFLSVNSVLFPPQRTANKHATDNERSPITEQPLINEPPLVNEHPMVIGFPTDNNQNIQSQRLNGSPTVMDSRQEFLNATPHLSDNSNTYIVNASLPAYGAGMLWNQHYEGGQKGTQGWNAITETSWTS